MDRTLLNAILASGPTRKYNVLALSRAIDDELKPGPRYLFDKSFLNRTILFKYVETGSHEDGEDTGSPIRTLIYMPYDVTRPGDGGESFVYTSSALAEFCGHRMGRERLDIRSLARDNAILGVLDKLPALNPFLIEQAFERAGIDVPRTYVELEEELRAKLKERLAVRIRPLIVAAVQTTGRPLASSIDATVDRFLNATDPKEIAPFVRALQLEEEHALDTIAAWIGITYFEEEYVQIEPRLKLFAKWVNQYPLPRELVSQDERELMLMSCQNIKLRLREEWNGSRAILQRYQDTYRMLLDKAEPRPFIEFLKSARDYYLQLGDLLGRLEQTIYAWDRYSKPYGRQALPFTALNDLYSILKQAHLGGSKNPDQLTAAV
ncbi:MAG: hypothetical protein H6923_00140 [Alphaproteobacteria bacterium]|nr:hypothetical protein [Alphaproteobacteria bacterium]